MSSKGIILIVSNPLTDESEDAVFQFTQRLGIDILITQDTQTKIYPLGDDIEKVLAWGKVANDETVRQAAERIIKTFREGELNAE